MAGACDERIAPPEVMHRSDLGRGACIVGEETLNEPQRTGGLSRPIGSREFTQIDQPKLVLVGAKHKQNFSLAKLILFAIGK